ncbi:MAG TPA: hypothetical protein VEW90_11390 [Gaiellaceae bacterium]|nr:hypothetical protein [Gaiellaceae bacterium]
MSERARSDRWIVGGVVLLATIAFSALVHPSSDGIAAPTAPPSSTAEPRISGTAEQGRTLTASRGSWRGTEPITYAYQWVRCGADGGRPDGGDCTIVSGATSRDHRLGASDVGFRMRVRVSATNAEGSRVAASNPSGTVVGPPLNTAQPFPRGSMVVGQVVTAETGTWTGKSPISYSYRWLRCNNAGGECASIPGGTSRSYRVSQSDVGGKLRFNLTARNSLGALTVISTESAVVSEPLPSGAVRLPSGELSIPATSVPSNHRLVVSQVLFAPEPMRTRNGVITVRVRTKDTRGFVVRDALVFVRSTPRVTTGGDRQVTTADGWVTYQLVPNGNFPKPRRGYHVQFFVKAYRPGDPGLGGIAGYRLVQMRLAG